MAFIKHLNHHENVHRCKICFKLLINWKGVRLDKYFSFKDNNSNSIQSNFLVNTNLSTKNILNLIKNNLLNNNDDQHNAHFNADFKLCKTCIGLLNELDNHIKKMNLIRNQLKLKLNKSICLFKQRRKSIGTKKLLKRLNSNAQAQAPMPENKQSETLQEINQMPNFLNLTQFENKVNILDLLNILKYQSQQPQVRLHILIINTNSLTHLTQK